LAVKLRKEKWNTFGGTFSGKKKKREKRGTPTFPQLAHWLVGDAEGAKEKKRGSKKGVVRCRKRRGKERKRGVQDDVQRRAPCGLGD